MFSISDIFNKNEPEDKNKPQVIPEIKKAVEPLAPPAPAQREAMNISAVVGREALPAESPILKALYAVVVGKSSQVYRPQLEINAQFNIEVSAILEKVIDALRIDNKGLMRFFLADYPSVDEFLSYHGANVSILSLDIAIGLGFELERLKALGICALVHDIGMTAMWTIVHSKNEKLNRDDEKRLKEHPGLGVETLNKSSLGLNKVVLDAVLQEHERLDGSGYPKGIQGEEINEYARIIGFCDTYEAMIHRRPFRQRYSPFESIKTILNSKQKFDSAIVKVFIEKVGIFPIGFLVRLNTKETAVVIKGNKKLPLRPIVQILLDGQGKKVTEPKQVDLAENSVIYIEECFTDYAYE